MSKFGINVPPGKPAHSLDDVAKAVDAMKDENNEVGKPYAAAPVWYLRALRGARRAGAPQSGLV